MSTAEPQPSAHALSLAGVDLPRAEPPQVRVEAARETVVVLPRSRAVAREVHVERCRHDRVPIVVRPSGGGAVVLARGVVAASVLAAAPSAAAFPEPYFRRFCSAVADRLGGYGVGPVRLRGVSDLCIGDRKVAGSALRLFAGKVLFQISILVEMDIALIERYLPRPSREPDYRDGRNHRDFLVTLREAGATVATARLVAELTETLTGEAAPR